jgi:hypothetical protein
MWVQSDARGRTFALGQILEQCLERHPALSFGTLVNGGEYSLGSQWRD